MSAAAHSASAVCMDKAVTHTLLSAANIEQAHYLWFYADRYFADGADSIRNKIAARLNFPVFVKPANAGSSVGVSKVTTPLTSWTPPWPSLARRKRYEGRR